MTVASIRIAAIKPGDMVYIPDVGGYYLGWGRVLKRYLRHDRESITFKLAGEFKLNDITWHVGRAGWNTYTEVDRYR